ncbi:MAG: hypothetical protein IPO21_03540 [Bacteroidales bacterium]|nr:hypothetical protein [Bacteroidales bacterium]
MKISGFTMAKNASKLYYPIKEAIASILPIVDEFIVALGDCDADDTTLEEINSLQSDKIRIIHTKWDIAKYSRGTENAHQTDIAKNECKGDWCFYLQADEVVHEKYLKSIYQQCNDLKNNQNIEGLLFKYKHFYGDYDHFINFHGWYPNEIRLVRNHPDIHSYISAQSFRRIPNFDGVDYRQKENTFKLNVAKSDAYIYHYGWVRPPKLMFKKNLSLSKIHHGNAVDDRQKNTEDLFDYGNLSKLPIFKETHPEVMHDFVKNFNWKEQLHFDKNYKPQRPLMKHEKLRSRILTFIEQDLFKGSVYLGYSNWNIKG